MLILDMMDYSWDYCISGIMGLSVLFTVWIILYLLLVSSNKSDLHVNIHLWIVCCIKYQGYLAYQILELPCFLWRKYKNTKMTKNGGKKIEAMSILHRNVDVDVKDVECRLQHYKQEICYFLYEAIFFHRQPASSFPACNPWYLL